MTDDAVEPRPVDAKPRAVRDLVITADDPRRDDVRALLVRHLEFARAETPPEDIHALDVDALAGPTITFYSARRDGALVAVGALRELDARHGELKSMHTASDARAQGVGRAMVEHLLDVARARGYTRVSLETGTTDAFTPARRLYERAGFTPCDAFGDYYNGPNNICMTLELDR